MMDGIRISFHFNIVLYTITLDTVYALTCSLR
jgi:hypothetical protein